MDANQLVIISGLEGNEPATLTPLQEAIVPFVPDIILVWWALWILVFSYMTIRYVIVPSLKKE